MGDGYFAAFDMTLRNYWSIDVSGHVGPWVYNDKLTRGGPMMRGPGFKNVEGGHRRATNASRWSGRCVVSTRLGRTGPGRSRAEFGLTFRPLPTFSIEIGPGVPARVRLGAVGARGDRPRRRRDVRQALRVRGPGPDGDLVHDAAQRDSEPADVAADVPAAAPVGRQLHRVQGGGARRAPTTSCRTARTPARSTTTRRRAPTWSTPGPAAPATRS